MRVAVSGASGFIGSALVPLLARRGHEVTPLARGAAPPPGCDALIHLANLAHAQAPRPLLRQVNVEGTRRMAQAAVAAGVRRMVYLSSAKVLANDDAYAQAKAAAEAALQEVAGLERVVLRPPLVYGPGVRANFLALLRAVDRGWPLPFATLRNRRSFVYLGNLCDAIARCVEAPRAAGTYGVADGEALSTPALCRALGTALGRRVRLFPFPGALLPARLSGSLEVDAAALRRELDWTAPFSLAQGLDQTVRWYRAAQARSATTRREG